MVAGGSTEGSGCDIGSTMWVWIINIFVLGQRLIIKENYYPCVFFPPNALFIGRGALAVVRLV